MFVFSDLVGYLAKLCIEGSLALICEIVNWCDLQKIHRCAFVCGRIGVSEKLDCVPLAVNHL